MREGIEQALAIRSDRQHTGSKVADESVRDAKQMGQKTDGY